MTFAKIKYKRRYTSPDPITELYRKGRIDDFVVGTSATPFSDSNFGEFPNGWERGIVYFHINLSDDYWKDKDTVFQDLHQPLHQDGPYITKDYYLNFETPLYFSSKEANEFNGASVRPPYAEISSHYNFYQAAYERDNVLLYAPEIPINEKFRPNMYAVLETSEKISEDKADEIDPFLYNHASVGGIIEPSVLSSIPAIAAKSVNDFLDDMAFTDASVSVLAQAEAPSGNYLTDYINSIDILMEEGIYNTAFTTTKDELFNTMLHVLFLYQDSKKLADFNRKRKMFPMDISIKFSRSESTSFSNMFKDTKIEGTFLKGFIDTFNYTYGAQTTSADGSLVHKLKVKEETTNIKVGSGPFGTPSGYETITEEFPEDDIKVFDINRMIQLYFSDDPQSQGSYTTLGDENPITLTGANQLYKVLLMLAFKGKYKTTLQSKKPSLKDLIEGNEVYSETLIYKVSKRSADESGDPLSADPLWDDGQDYYFFNTSEDDVIEFVDTQIHYGKRYNYRIYAYDMVVGLEYYYEPWGHSYDIVDNSTGEPGGEGFHAGLENQLDNIYQQYDITKDGSATLAFHIKYRPKPKLIETLIYETSTVVQSRPPLPPDVVMVPYRNVSDKILIMMNNSVGKRKFQPIQIEDGDLEKIQLLKESQDISVFSDQPIEYVGDDPPSSYEIFRIDKKPETYEDFKNNKIVAVMGDQAASFIQTALKANKKYYYTFRTVDIHNMFSNPTPIYELEMVENDGIIYPIIKIVDLPMPENKSPTKNMKKYIYIKPTDSQTFVNLEASDLTESDTAEGKTIVLGVEDESVWNKRYKFRFTSKSTGKKIDFNVKFKQRNLQT